MAADTTSLAPLIRPQVEDVPTIVKYSHEGPSSFLGRMAEAALRAGHGGFDLFRPAGNTHGWEIQRGLGNSSAEIFTEAGAIAAAGQQTWLTASLAYIAFRVHVQVSGFAMDDVTGLGGYLDQSQYGAAQLLGEEPGAMADLFNLINDTNVGSTSNGVLAANDSGANTPTYAGYNKTVLTDLASQLTAVGGVLTIAAMDNMIEALSDNPIGARPDAIFMPWNQATNYSNLVGPGAATSLVRYIAPEAGGSARLDAGFNAQLLQHGDIPIYAVPVMTDTVILFHRMQYWHVVTHRPIQRKILPNDADIAAREQLSTRLTLVCKSTRRQGKLTGVTA